MDEKTKKILQKEGLLFSDNYVDVTPALYRMLTEFYKRRGEQMNRIQLTGRLTKEPVKKTTVNGVSVTTFSIAVNDPYKKDEADFIDCVAWRGQADYIAQYIKKGYLVAVDGRLKTRTYEAQDGSSRKVYEVNVENIETLNRPKVEEQQQQTPKNEERQRQIDDDLIELFNKDDLPF